MKTQKTKNFYWRKKSLSSGDGYCIHHYWRFWSNPNETTEHPTNVFFLTKDREIDLDEMEEKHVAMITRRRLDVKGKIQHTEKICYGAYVLTRIKGELRCELIAALPMRSVSMLLDLTKKHLAELAKFYFEYDDYAGYRGSAFPTRLIT